MPKKKIALQTTVERLMALCQEQRSRWNSGDRVSIEQLLESQSVKPTDDRVVLELIHAEIRMRVRDGEEPQFSEYHRRFPNLEHELGQLFEVHNALWELNEFAKSSASGGKEQPASAFSRSDSNPSSFGSLVALFEQAWKKGDPPNIAAIDGLDSLDAISRRQLLQELVVVDMEYQWQRATQVYSTPQPHVETVAESAGPIRFGPFLEEYLQNWPEIGSLEKPPLALIVEEFRVRARHGDQPTPADYSKRFPKHGKRLIRLIERAQAQMTSMSVTLGAFTDTDAKSPPTPMGSDSLEFSVGGGSSVARNPVYDPDAPLPFGDFQLEEKIGSGGMGTVYRATQRSLDKQVAVKVLDGIRLTRPKAVQRFLREGRFVGQLSHPNIVAIHGIGRTTDGGYFMVMDLVDGQDLEAHIRDGKITSAEVPMLISVAEAIAHAHAKGVIHRDLKPSNILVDGGGRVMISDFGLAKLLGGHEPGLSIPDEPLGTPSYMAPEQASKRWGDIGPRTDVYGLGSVMFAMLTGYPPYRGRNYAEVIVQVVSSDPPKSPRELRPDIPEELEAICLKCLQKDQAMRYQTAQEVVRSLKEWISPQRVSVPGAVADHGPGLVSEDPGFGDDLSQSSGPPLGALPLESPFYVARPADQQFQSAVRRRDSIVLIRGARQMGKTSLLARGLRWARDAQVNVALTDLQKLHAEDLQSPERLFKTLGEWLADDLEIDADPEDSWDSRRSASVNFERFVRRQVLSKIDGPVAWGLDEVDRMFECSFRSEIFGLFRSWHNARALQPTGPWSRLTLIMAYATEAHLFITDPNQSPFNVGTLVPLDDFSPEHVAFLNEQYGSPLKSDDAQKRFVRLVGGHPYLVNRGLYEMASRRIDIAEFENAANQDLGVFGDHFRRLLALLTQDQTLTNLFAEILKGRACQSVEGFYGLRSAGFVSGESAADARPRCALYASYFGRHLP